jgi:hypothetical protein
LELSGMPAAVIAAWAPMRLAAGAWQASARDAGRWLEGSRHARADATGPAVEKENDSDCRTRR